MFGRFYNKILLEQSACTFLSVFFLSFLQTKLYFAIQNLISFNQLKCLHTIKHNILYRRKTNLNNSVLSAFFCQKSTKIVMWLCIVPLFLFLIISLFQMHSISTVIVSGKKGLTCVAVHTHHVPTIFIIIVCLSAAFYRSICPKLQIAPNLYPKHKVCFMFNAVLSLLAKKNQPVFANL